MTVKELLTAWTDHYHTDVIIEDSTYNCDTDDLVSDVVASYKHRLFNDWYCGQLSYLSTYDATNELIPYFNREIKDFWVLNTIELDDTPCIYITIK